MRIPVRRRGGLVLAVLAVLAAAACSAAPRVPSLVALPPASAGPEVVLDAYLRALVAGDCDTGRRLATPSFAKGNGELCGATRVSDVKVNPDAARPSGTEVVFATTITTDGTSDGSIQAGAMTWFYDLVQQSDGSWRLVGGGSGP